MRLRTPQKVGGRPSHAIRHPCRRVSSESGSWHGLGFSQPSAPNDTSHPTQHSSTTTLLCPDGQAYLVCSRPVVQQLHVPKHKPRGGNASTDAQTLLMQQNANPALSLFLMTTLQKATKPTRNAPIGSVKTRLSSRLLKIQCNGSGKSTVAASCPNNSW